MIAFIGIIGGALQAGFVSMSNQATTFGAKLAPTVARTMTEDATPMLAEAAPILADVAPGINIVPFYMTPLFFFFVGAVLATVAYIIIDWAWRKHNK